MENDENQQLHYIPIREIWQPEILHGYLPVPQYLIRKLEEENENQVISFPIEAAPPGTQLSFVLTDLHPDGSSDTELTLCAHDYPSELVARIQGYEGDSLIAGKETIH